MLKTSLLLSLAAATAFAGNNTVAPSKTTIPVTDDWCKSLWEIPTFYKNKDTFIQELRLIGRFHLDQYNNDSAAGHDSDWVTRRTRVGLTGKFADHFEFKYEMSFDLQNDNPAYSIINHANITWKPSDTFKLRIGKGNMPMTMDGAGSTNELLTLERSNTYYNLGQPTEYFSSILATGKSGQWSYNLGVASAETNKEFGNFAGGYFGLASAGYDFAPNLGAKKALLRADYVYNQPDAQSNGVRQNENMGALVFLYEQGNWGVHSQIVGTTGYRGQSDAWGADIMPFYNITDKLQVVARYTHMESQDDNGLRLNNRYQGTLVGGRGDEYDEVYAGLNYYICGHKLKLQTGWSYTTMQDSANDGGRYDGWSWNSGLRFSF